MFANLSSPALALALAMAIIGTVGAFVVEAGVSPASVVFWRCLFGSLALGLWCLWRGYLPDRQLSRRNLLLAAAAGACIVLSWVAFFASFGLTNIATTTIVYHVQPFFVVLIGMVFLRESISLIQLGWIVGAFIGVVLASGFSGVAVPDQRWLAGIALTLFAALLYALSTMLARQIRAQRPEITALCQTLIGMVLLAPFAQWLVPAMAWKWLAGIGILHTGIAYVLMYSAYPRLSTPAIAIMSFIYPLVAILIDWQIYGHRLTAMQMLGLTLIAGCTLAYRFGSRNRVRKNAPLKS